MTSIIISFFILLSGLTQPGSVIAAQTTETADSLPPTVQVQSPAVIPFYSQFADISSPDWQKVGCGVASLAMIIDYYKPAISVNTLLKLGISAGAYMPSAGWTHKGLISLSNKYNLDGDSYDLAGTSDQAALTQFETYLKTGPVIASVHYRFDPNNSIPHLVVINDYKDGLFYYNDPAAKIGGLTISNTDFLKAWKKRFIVIRPV